MRTIEHTTAFKKDYRREKRGHHGKTLDGLLETTLEMMVHDRSLLASHRDHALAGPWQGFRDCHLRPDLVLIYRKVGHERLQLVRLGSHAELFG